MAERQVQHSETDPATGLSSWWIGVGAFLLLLALWFGYVALALSTTTPDWIPIPDFLRLPPPQSGDNSSTLARRGQFGDAFGAFNALVSALAFAGLILTLIAQRKQLASQQKQSEASNRLFRQQQFQEQFYRAVDAYRGLLLDVTVPETIDRLEVTHRGRQALHCLWRLGLLKGLVTDSDDEFDLARRRQVEASSATYKFNFTSQRDAATSIHSLESKVRVDKELMGEVLSSIGVAWFTVYQANRFQFDALFRAWYTVYRVLDTAPRYKLDPKEIELYSATFRAQLSWIEMAFLLANQSALPPGPAFPRACIYSNKYKVFDNLVTDDDLVVSILRNRAFMAAPTADSSRANLTAEAFGSSINGDLDERPSDAAALG